MPDKLVWPAGNAEFIACAENHEHQTRHIMDAINLTGWPRKPSKDEVSGTPTQEPARALVRFQLTENMGATTANQASANVVDYTASAYSPTESITVFDPMGLFGGVLANAFGWAELVGGADGLRWEITGMAPGTGSGGGSTYSAGCGLTLATSTFNVNNTDLAGDGLTAGVNCQLDVNVGDGLEVVTDTVQVKYSTGLSINGSGELICTVTDTDTNDQVSVDGICAAGYLKNQLELGGQDRGDNAGGNACDETVLFRQDGCTLKANVNEPGRIKVVNDSESLRYLRDCLGTDPIETALPGVDEVVVNWVCPNTTQDPACEDGPQVDAYIDLNDIPLGCGLDYSGGSIVVDNTDLAGTGLTAGTNCSLDADVYVTYNAGDTNYDLFFAAPGAPGGGIQWNNLPGANIDWDGLAIVNIRSVTGVDISINGANQLEVKVEYDEYSVIGKNNANPADASDTLATAANC